MFFEGRWMSADEQRPKIKMEDMKGDVTDSVRNVQSGNHLTNAHGENKQSQNHLDGVPEIATNLIKYYGITCNTILGNSDLKVSIGISWFFPDQQCYEH